MPSISVPGVHATCISGLRSFRLRSVAACPTTTYSRDVRTEVPRVTILLDSRRCRLLHSALSAEDSRVASPFIPCTRVHELTSRDLHEITSRPASCGSHTSYPGAPLPLSRVTRSRRRSTAARHHTMCLTVRLPLAGVTVSHVVYHRVSSLKTRRQTPCVRGLNTRVTPRNVVLRMAPLGWSPNRTCVFRSHPALQ